MILDDLFADGQPEARAVGFAVRGKGLEQLAGHFRRDSRAGVLDFGDDFVRRWA